MVTPFGQDHFAPFKCLSDDDIETDKGWRSAFPLLDCEFTSELFVKTRVMDQPITADELLERLQRMQEALQQQQQQPQPLPLLPQFMFPYRISRELKAELLTAAFIRSKTQATLDAPIWRHKADDSDQLLQDPAPDTQQLRKYLRFRETIEPPKEAAAYFSSIIGEDMKDDDIKAFRDIRFKDVSVLPQALDRKCVALTTDRDTYIADRIAILDTKRRVRALFPAIAAELGAALWRPENPTSRYFPGGGLESKRRKAEGLDLPSHAHADPESFSDQERN